MAAWKRYIGVLALGLVLIAICCIGLAQETDSIDFGGVPVGQTGTASYTFKILETSETSATVTIYPPSPPFGLQDAPSGSFTLAPGQAITFGVTFTPTVAGDYTGSFTITAQGGYPVQEKTTTVYLTGHSGSGGEAPPPGETPTTPGITIPFPLFPPTTQAPAGAVPGTTDEEGKFKLALSPTTTVAGRLTKCEDGSPLPNLPFQLAKTDAGFSLFVSGYEEKDVTEFSRFSIMGLESYGLGDVCLTPVPAETAVPIAKSACETKYEWLKKTPIKIEQPLEYYPKQVIMPLGGIIAFHIKASDVDVLKQTCYNCVPGETVKRIGPVADVVSNKWSLLPATANSSYPAGKLIDCLFFTPDEGVLYQLPENVPKGTALVDTLICKIDDLTGPLAKADDSPLKATATITITRGTGNTCQVSIILTQPIVPNYDVDVTENSAEDCNPGKAIWEKGRDIIVSSYFPSYMCAGQLYLLHAHPDDIDIDKLTLKCSATVCNSSETTFRVSEPTTVTWSDNGAGGKFPFGNKGYWVVYQTPDSGKEIKITTTIDDSGTQYDDSSKEEEATCTVVKIVKVLPGDQRTHEIPSVLPIGALPQQHFVTVKNVANGQDKMRLEIQIQPNTNAAKRCIKWEGATADPNNNLVGLVSRTSPLKQPVTIKVGQRACKHVMAWVIWCTMSGELSTIDQTCQVDSNPNYNQLRVYLSTPRGLNPQGNARTGIRWTATVKPIEIITDQDRPNLEGSNTTNPPGGTNWKGVSLQRGVNSKWDISRQIRTKVRKNGNVMSVGALKAYFMYGNTAGRDSILSYPMDDRVGNDDVYTADETDNPYTSSPLGQLTSTDAPQRGLYDIQGRTGDQIEFVLQFREFVRVELAGNWYRCSDWGLWRFHIAGKKGVTGTCLWHKDPTKGYIHELNNNDW